MNYIFVPSESLYTSAYHNATYPRVTVHGKKYIAKVERTTQTTTLYGPYEEDIATPIA